LLAKRALDLVLGTLVALLALPVIALLALPVAIRLRAWPFFAQRRIGKHGSPIWFPKLRTLPKTTPTYAIKYSLNGDAVPGFCRFLRNSGLDELPQLLLVPFGKLSLVGPRPKMPDEFEPVDPEFGWRRTRIPQGCTGLWQIGQHRHRCPVETPAYDLFYLDRASVRMDLWIVFRTALLILGLARPTPAGEVPDWTLGSGFNVNEPNTDPTAPSILGYEGYTSGHAPGSIALETES
jgi:lipopolysaccharide/colanic/teichoic acid biosynthesis glycosyltransferase